MEKGDLVSTGDAALAQSCISSKTADQNILTIGTDLTKLLSIHLKIIIYPISCYFEIFEI